MSNAIRHPEMKGVLAGLSGGDELRRHSLGVQAIDHVLGGGLAAGRLHEMFADEAQDEASAMSFAVMLALLVSSREGSQPALLWLREETAQRRGGLYGPGLADLGLDPARLVLGVLPDVKSLLRAGLDAVRCAALDAVILELSGNPPLLDLTASRRLMLAAERSGVTPLLLRMGAAQARASAAQTRWQVASASSVPLEADAPGQPVLRLSLLRQRGGAAGFNWTVEWNRDAGCFRPAALPRARVPLSGGGPVPLVGESDSAGAGWRIAV